MDGPHDATVTAHKNYDDLRASVVTINSLLDHLVAVLAVIFLEHVEEVAVGAHILLLKLALHVALLVEEFLGFLVAGARICGYKDIVRVGLLNAIARRDRHTCLTIIDNLGRHY